MSQTNAFKQANNPDRVYYDIVQTNIGRDTETPARFIETTDTPIINNTGDYKMSVVRFQIDTPNMPVLIIQPSNDPNAVVNANFGSNSGYIPTDYNIFFSYYRKNKSNSRQENRQFLTAFQIDWKPENPNVYKPSFDEYKDGKHINFEYFYCYSYSYFFDYIVNQSIKMNYGNFIDNAKDDANSQSQLTEFVQQFSNWSYPPTFEWDEASQKINITAPPCYLTTDFCNTGFIPSPQFSFPVQIGLGNTDEDVFFISMSVSPNFYTLISTFPALETNFSTAKLYQLIFRTNFTTNWINNTPAITSWAYTVLNEFSPTIPPPSMTYGAYLVKAEQEWSSIDLMTPINSIVFTSNTLPLVLNQQSAIQSKNNKDVYTPSTQGSLNQHILVITDLMSNQQGYRPNILYVPSGQYRYITLTGNQPLNQIDINIFYQLKTGELIPFMLTNGGTASIKILFEKVVLGEAEKLQFANMSLRDLGL
jgi:hypothetical protein